MVYRINVLYSQMMKSSFFLIPLLLFTSCAFGQIPGVRYTTIVSDENVNPFRGTKVGMQISIVQGSKTGTVVYSERQSPTTDARGVADLIVGIGTVVSGEFSTIDWSGGPY